MQASRVGSIAAPLLIMLGSAASSSSSSSTHSSCALPYTVFGAASVLSGLLMLLMPNTRGAQLPETLEVSANCAAAGRHVQPVVTM
jgi:hypothetical protein